MHKTLNKTVSWYAHYVTLLPVDLLAQITLLPVDLLAQITLLKDYFGLPLYSFLYAILLLYAEMYIIIMGLLWLAIVFFFICNIAILYRNVIICSIYKLKKIYMYMRIYESAINTWYRRRACAISRLVRRGDVPTWVHRPVSICSSYGDWSVDIYTVIGTFTAACVFTRWARVVECLMHALSRSSILFILMQKKFYINIAILISILPLY